MFFNRNMSVIAYANGFTLWHYKNNEDTMEKIERIGYFDKIKTLCAVGDIIIINAKDCTEICAITEISPSVIIGPLSKRA